MPGAASLTFYERELADDLLGQAFSSFLEIGQQHAAPPPYPDIAPAADVKDLAVATFMYRNSLLRARLSHARNTVLFAAIAVEAAANYYAAARLNEGERAAVDHLTAPDKLLLTPRLAGRGDLFAADRAPFGSLRQLFKLRNRVVHPKVGEQSVVQLGSDDFTPATVCDQLIGAARALSILGDDLEDDHAEVTANFVTGIDKELRASSRAWSDPPRAPAHILKRAADVLSASKAGTIN